MSAGKSGNRRVRPPASRPLTLSAYRAAMTAMAPAAPLFLSWRERAGKEDPERRGERLGRTTMPRPAGNIAWFHAASVGETSAVLPLIEALEEFRPDIQVLLTTGTVTSARFAAARIGKRAIHQYVPLDTPEFARHFVSHWRPDIAIFAESEIWPSLIDETKRRGTPLVLVNGRVSDRSFGRWSRRPKTAAALFGVFDLILAQNDLFAERFIALGAPDTVTTGNLKMDAPPPVAGKEELVRLRKQTAGRPLFLAASTHPGEDKIIAEVHRRLTSKHGGLLTIIAPRHPHRGAEVETLAQSAGLRTARRSSGEKFNGSTDIYVADTIGELGLFYALAPVAFIGGSLVPHGGQNPVEAVQHDAVVLSGPNVGNFKDAYQALRASGGLAAANDAEELAAAADRLLGDEKARKLMLEGGRKAVSSLRGALERTLERLGDHLPPRHV